MESRYLNYLKSNARFSAWMIVFIIVLVMIPVLLISKLVFVAKVLGFSLIIFVSFALWMWRTQTARKITRLSRVRMTINEKYWLDRHIPFYHSLIKNDKRIFEDRIGLFLAEIKITQIGKEIPDKEVCLYVASSAIIAFWGLPYWNYSSLSEVLVYPDNFSNENEINRSGEIQEEVHHGGLMNSTMILSLRSLIQGFSIQNDGKNVGIHEFSHLLDKEDGSMDGVPYMIHPNDQIQWYKLIEGEINAIKKGKSDINQYGGISEVEFFAVLMEYYREKPAMLMKKHKVLYDFIHSKFSAIE